MTQNSSKIPSYKSARGIGARSFISNKNKYKYKKTPAAQRAAWEKRELLEAINLYGETYHAARCFPYQPWLPMPAAAAERMQQGLTRRSCNSRHDCPVCTSKFMAEKREDFRLLMHHWVKDGGIVSLMSLNLRNRFLDPTWIKYNSLSATWTEMSKRYRFKQAKKSLGVHFVRVLEEVLTEDGWFPHFHVVWFFPKGTSSDALGAFHKQVVEAWCEAANSKTPMGAEGNPQHISTVDQNSHVPLSNYLFKHAFHDIKEKAHEKVLSPFNLVRILLASGYADGWEFWRDFSDASDGKTRVRFSSYLKNYLEEKES